MYFMAKIRNDRQLRVTIMWIARFRRWGTRINNHDDSEPWLHKANVNASRSMVRDLLSQVSVYIKERNARPYIKHRRFVRPKTKGI